MKFYLLLLLHCFFVRSNGQYAIISDKDGYVNVRKDGATNSKIADSLKNNHLVYCLVNEGNWTNIDYSKANKDLSGYIYKDRYTLVSNFMSIPMLAQSQTTITFKLDSIEVTITQKPFEKNKHKLIFFKKAKDQIEFIDNKKYWGTDGEMPTAQYGSITVKTGSKQISLPKAAIENLYEPTLQGTQVNFDKKANTIYIQSMNSDGAGSYEVIWKIERGVYKEKFVAYGF